MALTERDAFGIAVDEARRLRCLTPRLSAAGIGGSLGRAEADEYSDIDLFLFFDSGDAFEHARWLFGALNHNPPPSSTGELDFFPGFGIRLSFVLPTWGKTEYFVNTPTSWSNDPMRASTHIVWDDTGTFTRLIGQTPDYARKESDTLHLALLASIDVRKHAARGELVSLEYRLAIARRCITALALTTLSDSSLRIHDATARAGSLPDAFSRRLSAGTGRGRRTSFAGTLTALHGVARELSASVGADQRWAQVAENLAAAATACR